MARGCVLVGLLVCAGTGSSGCDQMDDKHPGTSTASYSNLSRLFGGLGTKTVFLKQVRVIEQ